MNVRPACLLFLAMTLGSPAPPVLAQATPAPPSAPTNQPPSTNNTPQAFAASWFDPPAIKPGGWSTYHVTFNTVGPSIQWPGEFAAPAGLEMRLTARGQTVFLAVPGQLRTAINYRARAMAPGVYSVPEFRVQANGLPVTVPSARLEVAAGLPAGASPGQQLLFELAATNAFPGQPVKARVLLPATESNVVQGMQQVQLNGDGFMVDGASTRQSINVLPHAGTNLTAYIYETAVIPFVPGRLSISAQGFTCGNQFSGPIVIQGQVTIPGGPPQYLLLDSEPALLEVKPLPREGRLPGFTGAVGSFVCDPPKLATNVLRVGDLVKLTVTIRGEEGLARLALPPPPRARDWQVFAPIDQSGSAPSGQPVQERTFTYTLIPMTEETRTTPAIPFSCFDPVRADYVDLSIPSVPVTVLPGSAPSGSRELLKLSEEASERDRPLTFSGLAKNRGRTAGSLTPLQQRGWFWFVQIALAAGFAGVWTWDSRRRFLERHPDVVLRRRARRALRRERRAMRRAARAGDASRFAAAAVRAMQVAGAPHFPAEPEALVCGDIIRLLGENRIDGAGELARKFFAVADAARFGNMPIEAASLLPLQPGLERVLEELEAKL